MFRFLAAVAGATAGFLLTLPILAIGLPIWFVARLTKVIAEAIEPRSETWEKLIEFEPEIGWKPKSSLQTWGFVRDVFRVTTDSSGWRGSRTLADSEVVVFGDSFAWGQATDDAHFFGNLPSPVRIKAVGCNGYSMVHELLWMRRLAPMLEGKDVAWFIFLGNDLYDNLIPNLYHYRQPFVRESREGGWEIVTCHVSTAPWTASAKWRYYERLAELCQPGFLADRVYSACEFLISEGLKVCDSVGANLTVMTIPDRSQLGSPAHPWRVSAAISMGPANPGYPDDRIAEICREAGAGFVPLRSKMNRDDYQRYDLHWSPAGNRKVAGILAGLPGPVPRKRTPSISAPDQASSVFRLLTSTSHGESQTKVRR